MAFDPLLDLRRLLNDFTALDFSHDTLTDWLHHSAIHTASRGLLLQAQHVIDLAVGVTSYPLPEHWVQTFAVLHDDIQTYVVLRDQSHQAWYIWLDAATTELVLSLDAPPGFNLTPASPVYWLQWEVAGVTWYVYPQVLGDGAELIVSRTKPSVGAGLARTLELRQSSRRRWRLDIEVLVPEDDVAELVIRPMVLPRAQLRAPVAGPRALTLLTPEAWDRADPDLPPGPPQSVTIWHGHLWVYPTPDARYQLDHKYFAVPEARALPEVFPAAAVRLPTWHALTLALQSEGRWAAAQSMHGIFEQLLGYLSALYLPTEQDSRDEARVPAF